MSDFDQDAVVNQEEQPSDLENLLALAASHPNASAEVLALAATSQSAYVRCKVAENERASCDVLDELMHDCTSVRVALARNPKAVERVWSLATDSSPRVRLTLAKNANLPDHVYEALAQDTDPQVARQARRTLYKIRQDNNPVVSLYHLFRRAS
ncbi:MAG TPA: hypothetical protein V6C81_28730 [Planktothrix sp.]